MKCPKCGADVAPQERGGIVAYECGSCGNLVTEEAGKAVGENLADFLQKHLESMSATPSLHQFFEEAPLYKRVSLSESMRRGLVPPTRIELPCSICTGRARVAGRPGTVRRGFRVNNMDPSLAQREAPPPLKPTFASTNRGTGTGVVTYKCSDCQAALRHFWVVADFDGLSIQKVGQFPPPDISIPPDVEKLLDAAAVALYKKGAIAEAQAFGIGAFAYYRRVVEGVTSKLIDRIEEAMSPEQRSEHAHALAVIHAEHKAETRIQLAAKVLPEYLSPDGRNPLDILFTTLSQGLHEGDPRLDDNECLERATVIRKVLTFLAAELARRGAAVAEYKTDIDNLLMKIAAKKRTDAAAPSNAAGE